MTGIQRLARAAPGMLPQARCQPRGPPGRCCDGVDTVGWKMSRKSS